MVHGGRTTTIASARICPSSIYGASARSREPVTGAGDRNQA